jgi:hypothetical protein
MPQWREPENCMQLAFVAAVFEIIVLYLYYRRTGVRMTIKCPMFCGMTSFL